jgi:GTP pyrophosphokinase
MEAERQAAEQKAILEEHETIEKDAVKHDKDQNKRKDRIVIDGVDNMLIRFGHCCTPVPGDKITGYVTRGRGVSVHRVDCPNVEAAEQQGQRLIDVAWENEDGFANEEFEANLTVRGLNRDKLLNDVMRTVTNNTKTLTSINGRIENKNEAKIALTVGVRDLSQLEHIIEMVRNVPDIYEVKRVFN